jgi:hypothetical protein
MDKLFPVKAKEDGEEAESSTRRDNVLAEILSLYESNDNNAFPEQRGTAYNLLNSITEYTDHVRQSRMDARAESALFGSGKALKDRAFQLIYDEAPNMPAKAEPVQIYDFADIGLEVPSLIAN